MSHIHKPTAITRAKVEQAAGFGIDQDYIALSIGISPVTLRKHYAEELKAGPASVINKVAAALFRKASGKKLDQSGVVAAIFFLKAKAKWKDNHQTIEHTGRDGAALPQGNGGGVHIYLPDNGRSVALPTRASAPPMKVIEHNPEVVPVE